MVLRGCFGFVLGSVQSWSRGHASRTCPVPRTLKPAGVWLAPPPAPSNLFIVFSAFHVFFLFKYFHRARRRAGRRICHGHARRPTPTVPRPRRTGGGRALRPEKSVSRWRSPKSTSKQLKYDSRETRHTRSTRHLSKQLHLQPAFRRLTRRGDSLLTLLHSPLSALCAHMGAGISRLQIMRAPLRRPWPKLGLA